MLLSVHAIWGSASAPTAEHAAPITTPGDRAGQQNRQFIAALVERFRHFSDLILPPRRRAWCMAERLSPSLGHAIVRAKRRRVIVVCGR
jgi:hypothetical protein